MRRTVALTFDDGPDPSGTPAVLRALDALRSGDRGDAVAHPVARPRRLDRRGGRRLRPGPDRVEAGTHDWRGDDRSVMLARLEEGLVPGDVVLMHDGVAAGADDRDRAEPAFPEEPLRLLEDAGAPAATLPRAAASLAVRGADVMTQPTPTAVAAVRAIRFLRP